jgi:hypothetical protein
VEVPLQTEPAVVEKSLLLCQLSVPTAPPLAFQSTAALDHRLVGEVKSSLVETHLPLALLRHKQVMNYN